MSGDDHISAMYSLAHISSGPFAMATVSETPSVIAGVSAAPASCDLKEVRQPRHDSHVGKAELISKLQLQTTACVQKAVPAGRLSETETWEQSCWAVQAPK